MKHNTLSVWLGVIALILLAIVLIPYLQRELQLGGITQKTQMVVAVPKDQISEVTIQSLTASESTVLAKVDDQWQVNGRSADQSAVTRLLDALTTSTIQSVAATTEQTFDQLGVGSASAQLVMVKAGDSNQTLRIGKAGAALNTFYLRFDTQPEAYLAQGPLRTIILESPNQFLATASATASDSATVSE